MKAIEIELSTEESNGSEPDSSSGSIMSVGFMCESSVDTTDTIVLMDTSDSEQSGSFNSSDFSDSEI
ncbi:hypothetical protein JCM33374_g5106 [Metschnikowia sp. JCM 33374]|nr:hypothetical protein JCM33374_g5106 [Metschnikowia sp. JCM 33374]